MKWSLTRIEYVAAVFEHGSLSAAARALGVSQPTVSNALSLFEEEVGGPLFERSTRRLRPTRLGTTLQARIQDVLRACDELERSAREVLEPELKLLRVGFSPLLRQQRVRTLVEPFIEQHPDVELIYKECTVRSLEERLSDESIDVVFSVREARRRQLRSFAIHTEPMRVVSTRVLGASRDVVDVAELAGEQMLLTKDVCGLSRATRAVFEEAGVELRAHRGEALSPNAIREWAELGMGSAVVPDSHISEPEKFPVLTHDGAPAEVTYEAVWRRAGQPAHVAAFIKHLHTFAAALSRSGALMSA